jgi:hypothetical protein
MQFIGINETVDVSPDFPSDERLEKIIAHVHKLGGLLNGDIKLENIVRVSSLYAYGFKQMVIVSRRFLYKC